MPAIPLALTAGGAIIGAIQKHKQQQAQQDQMQQYMQQQAAGGGGSSSSWSNPNPEAMSGLSAFSKTGGFSPADLQNIRARALSPVRATYANAQREVNRQRAIQGGYSPGFNVLQARMAREQGQETSDAATNAEAGIAQMVQQGKLAGLMGMAQFGRSSGSSSGGGAGITPPQQKKSGFWGKLGGALGMGASVALPILMNKYGNGGGSTPNYGGGNETYGPSMQQMVEPNQMPVDPQMLPGFSAGG